jgi:hypothetical protein
MTTATLTVKPVVHHTAVLYALGGCHWRCTCGDMQPTCTTWQVADVDRLLHEQRAKAVTAGQGAV